MLMIIKFLLSLHLLRLFARLMSIVAVLHALIFRGSSARQHTLVQSILRLELTDQRPLHHLADGSFVAVRTDGADRNHARALATLPPRADA